MSGWLEYFLVLSLVAGCAAVAIYQIVGVLTGKTSGGCCGCRGGCGGGAKRACGHGSAAPPSPATQGDVRRPGTRQVTGVTIDARIKR